jgi:hypothetical protein
MRLKTSLNAAPLPSCRHATTGRVRKGNARFCFSRHACFATAVDLLHRSGASAVPLLMMNKLLKWRRRPFIAEFLYSMNFLSAASKYERAGLSPAFNVDAKPQKGASSRTSARRRSGRAAAMTHTKVWVWASLSRDCRCAPPKARWRRVALPFGTQWIVSTRGGDADDFVCGTRVW